MASVAGLTHSPAWWMSGDNVDVEYLIHGGSGGVHAGDGGGGAEKVMGDGVVVGALEAQAQAVLADVALTVAANLPCATGDAGV